MSTIAPPSPTHHAREQLVKRASRYITSVEAVWRRSSRVHIPESAPVPHHDEARVDVDLDVVLFARDDQITTAYGLSPEHITTITGVAVAAAVDAQHGTRYCSRIEPSQLEKI